MRRVLRIAVIVAALALAACGGGDDQADGEATTTTRRPTTTAPTSTTKPRPADPQVAAYCDRYQMISTLIADLPIDDLEALRAGADQLVPMTEELAAGAPEGLVVPSRVVRDAAAEMRTIVNEAGSVQEANEPLLALQSIEVEEAVQRIERFRIKECPDT